MITYENALSKAQKLKKDIDTVAEYSDAYVFYKKSGKVEDDDEVVILKDTGKVTTFSKYIITTKADDKRTVKSIKKGGFGWGDEK